MNKLRLKKIKLEGLSVTTKTENIFFVRMSSENICSEK